MGKLQISKRKLDRFHHCAMPNLSGAPTSIKNAAYEERQAQKARLKKEASEKEAKERYDLYKRLHPEELLQKREGAS